jgi:EmrB/QacA subfamily drug resistance transporter
MTTTEERAAYRKVRNPWLVQVGTGLSVIVTTFDSSSVNVALYTVAQHFAVDAGTVAWLSTLAFLIVTSTLLLFGRLSDQFGAKNVFVAGFVVYGVGALAAGLAPSFPLLLLARGLQALGVSMLSANALAILTECFPPHQRGLAVGVSSTIVGAGYFVGPIMAGQIIELFGWRVVFLALAPVAAIGFLVNLAVLPHSNRIRGRGFDYPGAGIFAFAATSLLLGINNARLAPVMSPTVLLPLVAAVAGFAGFVYIERRAPEPMLELSLFRNRLFSLSLASAFLLFLGITAEELLVPLFIQRILGESPAVAGTVVAIVPLFRMFLSSPAGMISDRIGSRWLATIGAVFTSLGVLGLSTMNGDTSLPWIVGCMSFLGLGTGLFFSPNMHAIMSSVPPTRLGVGSGALGLRRNLGQSLGVAVGAYLLQTGSGGSESTVEGFQLAFLVAGACVGLAAVLTFVSGSTPRHSRR